jgi:glyoxylase-like metal-dependent hydrolase (beta-lactamase superfamily II)/rhodanese-related sulfurtransferase
MQFRQFYLGCLSHASYYIGSGDEAAVIDPQRDVEHYLAEARAHGQSIKYVIETHSHADFVSGHVELAKRTGAKIVYGEKAATKFETLKVKDGDTLKLGDVTLNFRETPGHTPEGITIIAEEAGSPVKVFTGDTLFIGDVGRPDLIGSKGFTSEQMAAMLYDSLHEKILPLPDSAEIYPAHGAGSLCGKSLSKDTWSTLGEQRRSNYALQPMSKDDFVKIVAAGQPEVPQYFPMSAARNLEGSRSLEDLGHPGELATDDVLTFDGVVIDVRKNFEYGAGHVPNSINIGLGGQFASWSGTLIPIDTPIAIVAANIEQVDEAVMRLARVGHENVRGYILIDDFQVEKNRVEQVSVEDTSKRAGRDAAQFIDVRRDAEYKAGHAAAARNIPLDKLADRVDEIDPARPTYVICQGGYRSSIGCGILENAGFGEIYNVTGGTAAWIEAGLPTDNEAA